MAIFNIVVKAIKRSPVVHANQGTGICCTCFSALSIFYGNKRVSINFFHSLNWDFQSLLVPLAMPTGGKFWHYDEKDLGTGNVGWGWFQEAWKWKKGSRRRAESRGEEGGLEKMTVKPCSRPARILQDAIALFWGAGMVYYGTSGTFSTWVVAFLEHSTYPLQ